MPSLLDNTCLLRRSISTKLQVATPDDVNAHQRIMMDKAVRLDDSRAVRRSSSRERTAINTG